MTTQSGPFTERAESLQQPYTPQWRTPHDAPIFEALAERWERSGRSVPGEDDREWAELLHRCPWPGGW
ncbi:hypothetical protein NGB36_05715 [Streptomyces sp. RB6PN25]|uniref:Uncharacterized protein n=1 Tax=Streptomyces humicola TaxID=2953240 RepID=A0ABT1PQZ8_9ACTN|nr:hypothetical protein [Streptomyces humicola]MCQ4080101.1 hypothetical protein [Streptomyces humicola]